jgi:hypothetical protein
MITSKGMAWINALEGVAVGYAGLILQTKKWRRSLGKDRSFRFA